MASSFKWCWALFFWVSMSRVHGSTISAALLSLTARCNNSSVFFLAPSFNARFELSSFNGCLHRTSNKESSLYDGCTWIDWCEYVCVCTFLFLVLRSFLHFPSNSLLKHRFCSTGDSCLSLNAFQHGEALLFMNDGICCLSIAIAPTQFERISWSERAFRHAPHMRWRFFRTAWPTRSIHELWPW